MLAGEPGNVDPRNEFSSRMVHEFMVSGAGFGNSSPSACLTARRSGEGRGPLYGAADAEGPRIEHDGCVGRHSHPQRDLKVALAP